MHSSFGNAIWENWNIFIILYDSEHEGWKSLLAFIVSLQNNLLFLLPFVLIRPSDDFPSMFNVQATDACNADRDVFYEIPACVK